MISDLVLSALWHRLACINPPVSLRSQIQRFLVDFLWDTLHWVPQNVLFGPKVQGGPGLVHLDSRGYYHPSSVHLEMECWWAVVRHIVFMWESKESAVAASAFSKNVFSVLDLLKKQRQQTDSVLGGAVLDLTSWGGPTLAGQVCAAGVFALAREAELAGPWLDNPERFFLEGTSGKTLYRLFVHILNAVSLPF